MKRDIEFYRNIFVNISASGQHFLPNLTKEDIYEERRHSIAWARFLDENDDGRIQYIQNKLAGKHVGKIISDIIQAYPAMSYASSKITSLQPPYFTARTYDRVLNNSSGEYLSFNLVRALARDIEKVKADKQQWLHDGSDKLNPIQIKLEAISNKIWQALNRWRETYNFSNRNVSFGKIPGIFDWADLERKDFSKVKNIVNFSKWDRHRDFAITFPYLWEKNVKRPEVSDKFIVNQIKIADIPEIHESSLYKVTYLEGGHGGRMGDKSLQVCSGYLAQTNDGNISGLSKTEKYAIISLKKGVSRAFNDEIGV